MSEHRIEFTDAAGYERFMGRWSRAVAPRFLDWIEPRARSRWLDVGCGTGILTEALLGLCEPQSVVGIDCAPAQIRAVSSRLADDRATFRQADAAELPYRDGTFDVCASALVLNFLPDPVRGLAEMCRVTSCGGVVAGYVWDFAQELSPSGPLRQAMRTFGIDVPAIPGTTHSTLDAMRGLFQRAGLASVAAKSVDVALAYENFDDFWEAQTPSHNPTTRIIDAMTPARQRLLKRAVREALPVSPNGRIEYSARANMIRGLAPSS